MTSCVCIGIEAVVRALALGSGETLALAIFEGFAFGRGGGGGAVIGEIGGHRSGGIYAWRKK